MALTIRMRIDDNDEHQYYYATGSGTEIELIPLVVDSNGDYVPDEGKAYNRVTVNVPSTELETLIVNTNGTYNAPDGKAYNVVQVDVQSIINLQNKSASYTANGNYTIQADSGYDGLDTVSVAVNVPTPAPDLQFKSELYSSNGVYNVRPDSGYDGLSGVDVEVNVPATPTPSIQASKSQTITQNGYYQITPDSGYDGIASVGVGVEVPVPSVQSSKTQTVTQNGTVTITPDTGYDAMEETVVTVNVPTGGGGGDVLTGTVTVANGDNTLPITIPSGKTVKQATMYLTNFSDLANITYRRTMVYASFNVVSDGSYIAYGYRNSNSSTNIDQSDVIHDTSTTPELSTLIPLGIDATTGEVKYRGKSVDSGYSFISGYSYTYIVVLE